MELKKIKIECFKNPSCSLSEKVGEIDAFINPKEYTRSIKIDYTQEKIVGDPQATWSFTNYGSQNLTLGDIVVDGTGVVNNTYDNKDVDGYIKKFQSIVCDYIGDQHRPGYLRITWGKLSIICVCESFSVKYTLFRPDGTALRAVITLGLINTVDFDTKVKAVKRSSPDLTHLRTVKAGDTLPLMAYQIYGDSSFYLELARVNGLNNINAIKPGDQLYFPPLKN